MSGNEWGVKVVSYHNILNYRPPSKSNLLIRH